MEYVVFKRDDYSKLMGKLSFIVRKYLEVDLVEHYYHNFIPKWKEPSTYLTIATNSLIMMASELIDCKLVL